MKSSDHTQTDAGADDRAVAAADWAASGAMALTGYAEGPPLVARGAAATAVRESLATLGLDPTLGIGTQLLGERAALVGLGRLAPMSVGGAFRILPAADGWLGISLSRDSDRALVPALVEATVDDPWEAVARWAGQTPIAAAIGRAGLLGLPVADVPVAPRPPRRPGVVGRAGGPRRRRGRPLVVDLSSLWAGPLCAHLLGLIGCDIVKVESRSRPDGTRRGERRFFDLLHGGHRSVALDFGAQSGRAALQTLVRSADIVIEGSRPRALRDLDIDAEREADEGTIWVSITAYGRTPDDEHRVGFGDDIAAGAGLVAFDPDGAPLPAGDALADPLTGVHAAAATYSALSDTHGNLLDVSMHDVAAAAATRPCAATTHAAVAPPHARRVVSTASALGQHTSSVLATLHD